MRGVWSSVAFPDLPQMLHLVRKTPDIEIGVIRLLPILRKLLSPKIGLEI